MRPQSPPRRGGPAGGQSAFWARRDDCSAGATVGRAFTMAAQGFAMFDTAFGRCAIAWSTRGITGVQLPERDDATTRARLLKRNAGTREAVPPPEVARAIDAIVALTGGERRDLSAIVLDMEGVPDF